jgi:uroporphyrinogen-III decarboxylase
MNSRERVLASLHHQSPDRVPVDFGATPVSGIHCSCVAALREYYGLERRPVKVHEPYQMLGWIEEDLQAALGVDVAGALPPQTMFGFPNENWKPWRTPWGQEVLVGEKFNVTISPGGDVLIHPQGDRTAPPSACMPVTGYFFDSIPRQQPLDETQLNPADNLEEFGPLKQDDLDRLAVAARAARATGRAVVAGLPGTALGDIALVPAPFLKRPRGIRNVDEWYMALAAHPEYVRAVFEKQTAIALANLPKLAEALGDFVDIVFVCGTDFGTQTSSFCSVGTFDDLYRPYYRQITDWIHRHTKWKCFKHSCGAVEPFINSFIAAGFDILNPVQCSAAGMDPEHLKRAYGDRIAFWGGGVDTQHVLPFGTPAEVREQVLRRCEIFAPGGGFVFNAIHNIQARTPVANIVAMLDAVREFNGR